MYDRPGEDGYISPDALTRRLRFIPDRWEKGFSKQVQAWGSRAHFMQVRVLFKVKLLFLYRFSVLSVLLHYKLLSGDGGRVRPHFYVLG